MKPVIPLLKEVVTIEITKKKVIVILVLLLLAIAIPLTVYLSQRQQEVRSRASTLSEDAVIVNINGESITKAQVRKVAEEQYEPPSVDDQALKDALDTLIERKILDLEAQNQGVSLDPSEPQGLIDRQGLTSTQAYYDVLREKVTLIEAKNWQVFVIGFWVPPTDQRDGLTEEENSAIQQELLDGTAALGGAADLMSTDQDAVDIARSLVTKYPSLTPVLGVNGYILSTAEESGDLSALLSPKVYTFRSESSGQPFFDAIYAMNNPGEIKEVLGENDSGGNVIKLINANTTAPFNTYEDFLNSKKAALVQTVNSL